ncbi:ABC transporter ATP-binding protein [Legionella oakridgensis]|uniref:ABC transporter ATP-binding protein n=1 Tax=Legionella oakridgensis TaxID=29423 RepID=UPI0003DE22A8|nr:ABC transporter ATP-binding protein [Legionella oakridgensis]ETO94344.1 ABC-type antimicrobial peptide transport system, ATPase component [Legionella oakridgensis RV-2-2007]
MYISLSQVCKKYEQFKNNQALCNVTFKIEPQEKMIAIVGPSGSGKSTLLNLIAALDQPDSGKILVGSHNITRLNRAQLAKYRLHEIGIIFQFFNLFPTLTVFENIAVPGYLAKTANKLLNKKVEALAEQVGIHHLLRNYPHEISGGEAQRTAICRALINDPKLLLADEPTGNLDTETAKVIFALLQSLVERQKLTALIVTHDMSLIKNVNRVISIRNGCVHEFDSII